jgi:hypothetical protein
MQRSFIRTAALAFATVALAIGITVLPPTPAQSATFTFNDPNCSSFSYNTGTSTLSCVVSGPPVCTVTGPTAGTLNTAITLTASCSPAATSWTWTGGNCPGAGQTCSAVEAASVTRTYTVAGTNGTFVGSASPGFNVVWSNAPPASPSGCSVVQTPPGQLAVGGGNVTLTASCTGGNPVTWGWTGGFAQGLTTAAVGPGQVTSTTQFTATATNGGGNTPTNYTVQVSTGGGGGISCSGFSQTAVLTENWNNPVRMFTISAGGFPGDGAAVIVFTTGPTVVNGRTGGIIGSEYSGSPPATRLATLSTQPCDFGPGLATTLSNTPNLQYSVGTNTVGAAQLQPNTTYYINIMNPPGNCTGGNCNMSFDFGKPRGT